MPNPTTHHPSSYKDPSGFVFGENGVLYRQVNLVFKEDFDLFMGSGCYESLVKKGLIIPHEQINENKTGDGTWYTTLKPALIPFISYPYEWSFDMLKDAALLTLKLVKESISYGMILKDATPYNIQWYNGRLIFIDSLSFEKYKEDEPWVAYRQFCENFLAPLLLMHYSRKSLEPMTLAYPDGIPLPVASSLLPGSTKFSLHIYLHIHLHAKMQQKEKSEKKIVFTKRKLLNILSSLETLVNRLKLLPIRSTWSGYYEEAAGRSDYLVMKKKIIGEWLDKIKPRSVVDLGANEGGISQLAAAKNIPVIAADMDPYCINNLYNKIKTEGQTFIHPLVMDLGHPSPAIGFNNEERVSFIHRAKGGLVMALALVHHLAIGRNIPFPLIADLFNRMSEQYLIVEFVPKEDEKIRLMLSGRRDIFTGYDTLSFEKAFEKYFRIDNKQMIGDSGRVLYLMSRHEG